MEVIEIRGHHLASMAEYFYLRKKTIIKENFNERCIEWLMDSEFRKEVGYTAEFRERQIKLYDKIYTEKDYKINFWQA